MKRSPVVIGAGGSSISLAIAPIANQHSVVQISPLSSAGRLSYDGGEYFFRVCPANDQKARVLATWVVNRTYDKVAVVYTDNVWGSGLAESFRKHYTSLSRKQIAVFEAAREGASDFRTTLAKIKAEGCGALFTPTEPQGSGLPAEQARELDVGADLYGTDNWGTVEFLQTAGAAANGCFFVAHRAYDGPESQSLYAKVRTLTNKEADFFVAYGYDTVYAIAYAAERAQSWQGPAIREALLSVRFQGASGVIEFDERGDLKTNAFEKKVILQGKPHDYKQNWPAACLTNPQSPVTRFCRKTFLLGLGFG